MAGTNSFSFGNNLAPFVSEASVHLENNSAKSVSDSPSYVIRPKFIPANQTKGYFLNQYYVVENRNKHGASG